MNLKTGEVTSVNTTNDSHAAMKHQSFGKLLYMGLIVTNQQAFSAPLNLSHDAGKETLQVTFQNTPHLSHNKKVLHDTQPHSNHHLIKL